MHLGYYIIAILLAAVFLVIMAGVLLMGKGGAANLKYSNKLMIARVSLQALVILILIIMYFFRN